MLRIPNPYLKAQDKARINCDVDPDVYLRLLKVFPGHGHMQAVTNTLIENLIKKLDEAQIFHYEYTNEQAIKDILYGTTTNKPNQPGPGQANSRATGPDRNKPKKTPSLKEGSGKENPVRGKSPKGKRGQGGKEN